MSLQIQIQILHHLLLEKGGGNLLVQITKTYMDAYSDILLEMWMWACGGREREKDNVHALNKSRGRPHLFNCSHFQDC